MNKVPNADPIKIKGFMSTLKGKSDNHPSMYHHANGIAKTADIRIRKVKLLKSKVNKVAIEAPNTFLIPISFLRCSVT